jgi:hypothetical protein
MATKPADVLARKECALRGIGIARSRELFEQSGAVTKIFQNLSSLFPNKRAIFYGILNKNTVPKNLFCSLLLPEQLLWPLLAWGLPRTSKKDI